MIARSASLLALVLAGAVMLPAALSAQQTLLPDSGGARSLAASVAPAPAMLGFAPHTRSMPGVSLAPAGPVGGYAPPDQVGAGNNAVMMGVGGAGVVAGLLIGGDAGNVMVSAGAVIGLIGLIRYVR